MMPPGRVNPLRTDASVIDARDAKANKTAVEWDRKLANRTARMEGKQKANDGF